MPDTVGVSSGTASLLGFSRARNLADPTTAYLLVGGRCQRHCAFCAQAKTSRAPAHRLSRVEWPPFPWPEVREALLRAYEAGRLLRACLQVTDSPQSREGVLRIAQELGEKVPLSASLLCGSLAQVEELLAWGLERVALSLDGATADIYRRVKGGDWEEALAFLEQGAKLFPGQIATHLMVGLGESEREVVELLGLLYSWGVTTGLFAFTPIRSTALEGRPPPELAGYRRLQVAHFLIRRGVVGAEDMGFSPEGGLVDLGMGSDELKKLLGDGEAFRTSGCPGCNRPFYNERPRGVVYNYPWPPSAAEAQEALAGAEILRYNTQ